MEKPYKVAIQFDDKCGFVEYEPKEKSITVILENQEKRREIEKYLAIEHTLRVAENSLVDFSEKIISPWENTDSLKIVLTRLWQNTGVMVDWSRPV